MNKLILIGLNSAAALTLYVRGFVAMCLILVATPSYSTDQATTANSHSLVILIDNSAAMKKAGAEQHVPEMIKGYVQSMPDNTRFALIAYDDLASVLMPLSATATNNQETLLNATRQLEFSAQHSNLGAGLERALFELGVPADNPTAHAVLLVHAGTIDTGNVEQNQSFRRWAASVLVNDAKTRSIPIYVLTLGDHADQDLSKRLAANTYGLHRHAASVVDGQTNIDVLKSRFLTQIELAAESTPVSNPDADTIVAENTAPMDATDQDGGQEQLPPQTMKTLAEINGQTTRFPTGAGISKTSTTGRTTAKERFILPNLTPKAGQEERQPSLPATVTPAPDAVPQSALFDEDMVRIAAVAILASGMAALIVFLLRRKAHRGQAPKAVSAHEDNDAVLTDVQGVTGQNQYVITERLVRICRDSGRNSLNVVCVTIPDDVISREHAFIEYRDNDYWVTDTGSNNGTFVNDKRIKGSKKLKHGDRLRFATYEFLFEQAASQPALTQVSDPADATLVAPGASPSIALKSSEQATRLNGIPDADEAQTPQGDTSLSETMVKVAGQDELNEDRTQVRIPPAKG